MPKKILCSMNLGGNLHQATSTINRYYPEIVDDLVTLHMLNSGSACIAIYRAGHDKDLYTDQVPKECEIAITPIEEAKTRQDAWFDEMQEMEEEQETYPPVWVTAVVWDDVEAKWYYMSRPGGAVDINEKRDWHRGLPFGCSMVIQLDDNKELHV